MLPCCCCSEEESDDVTNDELSDHHHPGVVGHRGNRSASEAAVEVAAGDMSDDLYSEISSRDTQQLIKSRTRHSPLTTSTFTYLPQLN